MHPIADDYFEFQLLIYYFFLVNLPPFPRTHALIAQSATPLLISLLLAKLSVP